MRLLKLYLLVALFALPLVASAAGLSVVFQATPLFGEAQFMPGALVSRTVEVKNTDAVAHALYTRATSTLSGGLEEAIDFTITSDTSHFNGTLAEYYGSASVFLGTLAPNETKVYTFGATFRSSAADSYQGKTTKFDIEVGFEGGEVVTDTGGGTTGSTGGTTSGGSGGTFGVGGSGTGVEPRVLGDSIVADFVNDFADNIATVYNAGAKAVARVLGDEDIAETEGAATEALQESNEPTKTVTQALVDTHCQLWWLLGFVLMLAGRILIEYVRAQKESYKLIRSSTIVFAAFIATAFATVILLGFPCSFVTALTVGGIYVLLMSVE
ncbi:hypothetical protein A3C87_01190 [Candidatus Kaiserbacteria bacterium RIFCSPHIGHO2_02_FULL_49_34]|uniref:Uncharacterized protein n=1 Tax=Candidatus Kaiserbacteria bacterium RIFCSPHIGHO2_02_FULL_49_34 TaxID=1798491 RepID=A0A1F6DL91_9BACT|nr:MAG: hypothetical protein A3C87_01190 [Candidatus Kaiserbacteria bacterium RIFCSPHIGHO2_02_FULL_49_34]